MKIGILTFHMAHNYGAMLQAYSLQEYLKSLGHEVAIIDYKPLYFENLYKRGYFNIISRNPFLLLRNILLLPIMKYLLNKRYDAFIRFSKKYYNTCKMTDNFDSFDVVFCGSDQIWNKEITGGEYDSYYWGKTLNCRAIAYAASGKVRIDSTKGKDYVSSALDNFLSIGVRESSLAEILQPLSSKRIEIVCDPTILAGEKLLSKLDMKVKFKDKYILIYELVVHPEVRRYAEKLAKLYQYKIIELTSEVRINKLFSANQTASPKDFISLIKNASVVLTTSFHGTALSVIFKRDFYYFRQHNSSDSRIIDLLEIFHLQNRVIELYSNPKFESIDYGSIDNCYEEYVESSKKFISKSLELCSK